MTWPIPTQEEMQHIVDERLAAFEAVRPALEAQISPWHALIALCDEAIATKHFLRCECGLWMGRELLQRFARGKEMHQQRENFTLMSPYEELNRVFREFHDSASRYCIDLTIAYYLRGMIAYDTHTYWKYL